MAPTGFLQTGVDRRFLLDEIGAFARLLPGLTQLALQLVNCPALHGRHEAILAGKQLAQPMLFPFRVVQGLPGPAPIVQLIDHPDESLARARFGHG